MTFSQSDFYKVNEIGYLTYFSYFYKVKRVLYSSLCCSTFENRTSFVFKPLLLDFCKVKGVVFSHVRSYIKSSAIWKLFLATLTKCVNIISWTFHRLLQSQSTRISGVIFVFDFTKVAHVKHWTFSELL